MAGASGVLLGTGSGVLLGLLGSRLEPLGRGLPVGASHAARWTDGQFASHHNDGIPDRSVPRSDGRHSDDEVGDGCKGEDSDHGGEGSVLF